MDGRPGWRSRGIVPRQIRVDVRPDVRLDVRLGAIVALALALSAGCGNGPGAPVDAGSGPQHFIRHIGESVAVAPNGSKQLSFLLVDGQERPVPNQVLQFQIAEASTARGATLSIDRGVTDARGLVSLQVISGLTTIFILRVSAERAEPMEIKVYVDSRKFGPVEVAPMVVGAAGEAVASIRLFFVSETGCARILRSNPTPDMSAVRTLMPGQVERYSTVRMDSGHAIVGHGLDAAGVVVVDGCVDLSGAAILEDGLVRVVLPLARTAISPVGRFRATSQLQLAKTPKAAAAMAEAWVELAACQSDPGRLWLDCTVDALTPETAEDPLDCLPSATDEGAFDRKLAARRGLPVRETTPTGTSYARCRQRTDAAGDVALEERIASLFASPTPTLRTNLEGIVRETSTLLSAIGVVSYFQVRATSRPDRFQIDHQLEALELGEPETKVPVNLWRLGLPLRTAWLVPAVAAAGDITLEQHGFTVRLGSAARLAVEEGILSRRGYPADTAGFVTSIFAAASYTDRNTTFKGCPALAALVCPLVGAADGCLVEACQAGVAALGRRLSAVFSRLNGSGLDLFLEGTAPLIERDGDGRADSFGWLLPTSPPGVWSGTLTVGEEQHAVRGIFTADRE
jgi:hypothetical protein